MIDRLARNKLLQIIRDFQSGLIDNFMFDDAAFSIKTRDQAVIGIRKQVWHIYDKFNNADHKGIWALGDDEVATIHQYILFLKTDFKCQEPTDGTDMDIWPFSDLKQFKTALSDPLYQEPPIRN
ncbi:MAG: hypothetical protein OEZ39_06905 [Gammaproteobacteria bacterium]|nr:hypothetical protein [Gammaproteobacteria bacterium]MDH5651585.1 hypothetical protein [Gammaproteobacteria bacterium]